MLRNTFKLSPDADGGGTGTDTTTATDTTTSTTTDTAITKEQFDAVQAEAARLKKANDNLASENAQKNKLLKDKMTAEEIAAAEKQTLAQENEALKTSIEENKIAVSRSIAESVTTSVKELADIKADDKEFTTLVHSLSSTDKDNTTKLATYFAKIVKQAYDKGVIDTKADGTSKTADGVTTGGEKKKNSEFEQWQASKVPQKSFVDLSGKTKKGE